MQTKTSGQGSFTSALMAMVERMQNHRHERETEKQSPTGAGPAALENNMVVTYDPVSSALSRSTPPMLKELRTHECTETLRGCSQLLYSH